MVAIAVAVVGVTSREAKGAVGRFAGSDCAEEIRVEERESWSGHVAESGGRRDGRMR